MTGDKLRKELKKIGDRNRRFNLMTPEKKRITLAKDTIAALNAKKIAAITGMYLGYTYRSNGDKLPDNYKCEVCALGGMFVGLTTRIKNLSVKTPDSMVQDLHRELKPYFREQQLFMIECAYEYAKGMWLNHLGHPLFYACKDFGAKYANDRDRLVAIMQNIIDNNGEFKP